MQARNAAFSALVAGLVVMSITSCSGPVTGIDSLVTGTGFQAGHVTGQTTDFTAGQSAYVVFTTHIPKHRGVAVLQVLRDGSVEDTSLAITVVKGNHTYHEGISLMDPGTVTIEVSYNGSVQQTTQVEVR